MVQVLAVIQVLLSMALVGLILMHSGRDAGLGGMGFTPASQGYTHRRAQSHEVDRRRRHPLRRELHRALPRAEVAALCAGAALIAAGCGAGRALQARPSAATGPPNVVRVALTSFRWPLDPALVESRDETTLARALFATPLRTDPVTGAVVPGLCTAWKASSDFRRWTFNCRSAPS